MVKPPEKNLDKEKESQAKSDDPWAVSELVDDSAKWGGEYARG